ncbi:MAG: hypothetical protein EHM21_17745, partial [Chloroflexi bacterium]
SFKTLNDFIQRVDLRTVGKRSLECLIKVGALDALGPRPALLEALDQMLSVSASHFKALQSGQLSFFGSFAESVDEIVLPFASSLDTREQLEWERELLGLYVSDHPLSPYLPALKRKITHFSGQLGEARDKEKVTVAGMVTRFRPHQTKGGKAMGFATLEDIQGLVELVLFPRTWDHYSRMIVPDHVLVAEGKLDAAGGDPKVLVDRLDELDLEEALKVKDIDASTYIPPAVLAVYGEKGMPVHSDSFDSSNLEEADDEEPGGFTPDVNEGYSANLQPRSEPVYPASNLQPPQKRIAETAPVPHVPAPPPVKPSAPDEDEGPPLWPDDWDQFAPAFHADYCGPVQAAVPASQPMEPVEAPAANTAAAASPMEKGLATSPPGKSVPESSVVQPEPAFSPEKVPNYRDLPRSVVTGSLPEGWTGEDTQAPPFLSMPFFVPSAASAVPASMDSEGDETVPVRLLTVILHSTNDKAHDVRRLRRIHGTLRSFPGKDKYAFMVFEGGRRFLLEFPNDTTGI